MTDIRSRGLKGKQLEAYLADLEDDLQPEEPDASEGDALQDARREIAWLRKDVFDLRERLSVIRNQSDAQRAKAQEGYPWIQITAAAAAALIAGRFIWQFTSR